MTHIEVGCHFCLGCQTAIPANCVDEDCTLLVSVKLGNDETYDAVLAYHPECFLADTGEGLDLALMNVKALGRALMLAAEWHAREKAQKRESKSQAKSSHR
jgi:hypothetical protein